jgi:transposase-like protein
LKQEIEAKRKAFIGKPRLQWRAVADSLEEDGDKLLAFTRFPESQWKSTRTSNAIALGAGDLRIRIGSDFVRRKSSCISC